MAIRYLYPVPPPAVLIPDLPAGFELTDVLRKSLPQVASDQFLRDLRGHRGFTKPKWQEHWDAIDLMIQSRNERLERGEADYYDVPGQVLRILVECVDTPVFFHPDEGGGSWVQGYPYHPKLVRELVKPGGLIDMIKKAKDLKPAGRVSEEKAEKEEKTA